MPIVKRPCGELVSSRSVNILSTIAVLLMAVRKPQNTPWLTGRPKAVPASTESAIADPIWRSPPPITCRSDAMCARDTSTPMVNSSITTPTSARISTCETSSTTSRP